MFELLSALEDYCFVGANQTTVYANYYSIGACSWVWW